MKNNTYSEIINLLKKCKYDEKTLFIIKNLIEGYLNNKK